ncbi:quinoprotein dehydrogenase-associated SoxYZ-like carrier [Pelomonas sp. KK5]|uniref:quinoprotein dehydrogenase-associated SoxYZ-like carrier n=1 Tax=Pelomonas sp. KK5 TaxID=1855730 RepID=UPI00097C2F97|nr:quinoprotein dehydrogenase-associated SoxYZ-like carrier [Pelomonas sp. KK5]
MLRATLAFLALALSAIAMPALTQTGGDPFGSLQWPELKRGYLGEKAVVLFDPDHVLVEAPAFAEDPMNVPVSVSVRGLTDVVQIVVIVDRNPIRKVLEFQPLVPDVVLPAINFRFKLEQASPVRAAVKTRDGVWHVGGAWVDAAGGGCTVPGASRRDGSWARTLGEVGARRFDRNDGGTRLRLRVMHPMDTGLANGIPAFYMNRLAVFEAAGRELLRLRTYEPLSENPVLSFDFGPLPPGPLKLVGSDNNGNRIARIIE